MNTNFLHRCAKGALMALAYVQAFSVMADTPDFTVVPLSTNLFGPAPTNSILAASTNNYPATYVYTNAFGTAVTNTVLGYIYTAKLKDLSIQTGFSCTNPTDVSNVVWRIFPSLDGVNFDTSNLAFCLTNVSPGSNTLIQTFTFSEAQMGAIPFFLVTQSWNENTNPIFPALTNSGTGPTQFMQVRGTRR